MLWKNVLSKWVRQISASKKASRKPIRGRTSQLRLEELESRVVPSTLNLTGGVLAYADEGTVASNAFALTLSPDGTTFTLTNTENFSSVSGLSDIVSGGAGSTSVSFLAASNSFTSATLTLNDSVEAVDTPGLTLTNQDLSINSSISALTLNGSIATTTGNISLTTLQNGLNAITVSPGTSIATTGGTVALTAPDGITDSGAIGSSTTGAIGINGPLSGAGNIITGTANVTDTQATNSSFTGVISGGFGLDTEGTGTLSLSGTNTYSGSTIVDAGTLQLGSPTVVVPNASFETPTLSAGTYYYNPGPPSSVGSWTFNGFTGIRSNNSAWGSPNAPDGTQVAILQQTGNFSQSINFPSTATYVISFQSAPRTSGGNDFNVLVDGTSYGTFNPGTAAFTSYSTSSFTVSAGPHVVEFLGLDTAGGDRTSFIDKVAITSTAPPLTNVLPATTSVTVAAGATLDLSGSSQTIGSLNGAASSVVTDSSVLPSALTVTGGGSFAGNLTGTGLSLSLSGAASPTLTLSGIDTYGGATTIASGNTLQAGSTTALAAGNLTVNGTLDLNGFTNTAGALTGSGSVVDTASPATLVINNGGTFSGNITGVNTGLTVAGTLTLSGSDTYGGPTTINGTLQAGGTTSLSINSAVTDNGTLNLNGNNNTIGSLAGAGSVLLGTGTLTTGADNTDTAFTGAISGAGGLHKVGTGIFTFSGQGTYGGGTTVSNAGTLQLSSPFVPPGAPVAYYTFNGNISDSSGHNNNGSFVGGTPTYVTGQFGQALSFNGSQAVMIPYSPSLASLNSYTVSAWVNMPAGFGNNNAILGTRLGGEFTFDVKVQSSSIHGDVGNGGGWINTSVDIPSSQGGQLTAGLWSMITYVVDAVNHQFRLYVNNTLEETIAFSGTPLFMGPNEMLGIGEDSGGEFMNGAIDDVAVYGQALNGTQIGTLFTHATTATPLPTTTGVSIDSGATLDLNGVNQPIGSFTGSGAVTNSNAATPATLTVNGGGSFSGAIQDGGGTVALTVAGASQTLTLSGASNYSGQTTVDSTDTLLVVGSEASPVNIQSGGILGGTGTTGAVSALGAVKPGSPASSVGTLTANSADFSGGGNLTVNVTGSATITSDSLNVTNNLTLGGTSTLTIDLNGLTTPAGTLTIVSDGSQSGQFSAFNVINNPHGFGVSVSYTSNTVVINVVAAPPAITSVTPSAGATVGGTVVDILGTGFVGTTAVNFGSVAATSYTVVSGTEIMATAPAGTGTVDITVSGPLGTSAITAADQFSYFVAPVITPNTNNLPDISSTITINGSGFSTTPANDAVTFNLGVTGTVLTASANQLVVQITTPPTALGALNANVITNGALGSGFVQVGNVVNATWVVTDPSGTAGGGSLSDITLPYAVSHALSGDAITFAGALSGDTITLTGTLAVHSNITITGPGAANLTISGNNAVGDFTVASGVTASIAGLTITGGQAATGSGIANSGTLTLSSDIVSGNAGGDIFIASSATLIAGDASAFTSSTIVNDLGTLDLHGNSESIGGLNGNGTVSSSTAGTMTLTVGSGVFSGIIQNGNAGATVNLAKTGTGTLLLGGGNTYTGTTVVNGGTVQLINASVVPVANASFETPALGGGGYQYGPAGAGWIFNSAGVQHNGSPWTTITAPSGTQTAFLQSFGFISQTINFPLAGTYTISFLAAYRSGYSPDDMVVTVDGTSYGTFTPASATAFTAYSTSPFTVAAGTHTITFLGLDSLGGDRDNVIDVVSIASTTPPPTSILPAGTALTVTSGTLDLNGFNQTVSTLAGSATGIITDSNVQPSTLTVTGGGSYSGNLTGANTALTLDSGSNLTLTLSGTDTYGGATTVNSADTLKAGSTTAFSGASSLADNGTLDLNGYSNSVGALNGSGTVTNSSTSTAATLSVNGGGTFAGVIEDGGSAVGLTVAGANRTLTLSGSNTFSGQTTIDSSDTLVAGAATALSGGAITANGTLNLNDFSATIGSLAGSGNVLLGAANLTTGADNTDTTFSGAISGAGSLVKIGTGTFTFTGQGTYAGTTTVNDTGTLKLGANPLTPVAEYLFNGDTTDSSGNANNGTFNGGTPSYVSGPFGQALSFNGSESVAIPYSSSLANLNSYTVSAWVNMPPGFGDFNGILGTRFGGDTTFDLKVMANHIHGDVGSGTGWLNTNVDITGAAGQVPASVWTMITYVINNATQQADLYVNGTLAGVATFNGTPLFMKPGQTLMIGNSSGTEFMNGSIADVNIFGSALSDTQINFLYTQVSQPLPTTTDVTIASGATLDLNGINQTVNSLNGSGTVRNTNATTPGTLTETGTGSFTGTIVGDATTTFLVNGTETGTMTVAAGGIVGGIGSAGDLLVNSGTVNPGSPADSAGTLTANSADFSTGGDLTVDITGSSILSSDLLNVTNHVTLGGTSKLTVDLNGLDTIPSGPITIVSDASQTGQFATVNVVNNPGFIVTVSYTSTSVVLSIVEAPPTVTSVDPTAGLETGGTSVNIFGTGFLGATEVQFGGVDASFTVVSITEITAIAPPGTGVVDVVVSTPNGVSPIANADQYTYVLPPAINANTNNLADSATTITITGSNFSTNPANDSVTFNLGVTGTVVSATATQLTVQLNTPPNALGELDAVVSAYGIQSNGGAPVQVATETNGTWTVTTTSVTGGTLANVTLPYAVSSALSGDTITFAGAGATGTIVLSSTLNLATDVTITGPGSANLAVSGNHAVLVFNIQNGVTASISGLTIENGANGHAGYGSSGGGVANAGTLSLSNDLITNNTANNSGGGVYNTGTLTLTDSTISNNTAAFGAGLNNSSVNGSPAVATANNCTFTGNTATNNSPGSGSGVSNWTGNSLTLTNSTVAFNSGGMAAVFNGGVTLNLLNDTVAYNTGDGVDGATTIDNTIVAGNTGVAVGTDGSGNTVFTGNYNLTDDASGSTISGTNNQFSVSAGLAAALANNGGSTQTLALQPGSAALATGDPGQTGTTSQNNVVRPATPDIGAYQTNTAAAPTVISVTPSTGPDAGGTSVTIVGTGFTGATQVQFGNTNATSFIVNSDTSITAFDPAGTGVVDITVVTANGTSATSNADQFSYVSATTITLVNNGPNPSTSGEAVSFTVTVTGGTPINGQTVTIEDADAANAPVGTGTLSDSTVTFNISNLTVGTHHLFAVYGGDAAHSGSNSSATPIVQNVIGGGAAPAVVSVVVNGGAPQYTDGNGVQVSLAGQNSIVEQLLVTFNEAVTLDAGAFTISTNLANFQSLGGIELPNTDPVGLNAPIPVTGSGGTQFILTFLAGSGVNSIPGPGIGTYIKDGVYNLNTIGSHVHANSQTAVDNHAGFWALFGSVAADNLISGSIGDGNSDILVDTPDAAQFKIAFGTENDSSLLPDQAYDAAMDSNLSGVIGTEDAAKFKHNFGTEWMF